MDADNYYSADALAGAAGALWLPSIAAFDGVAAAFTTKKTRHTGAAAAFSGAVLTEEGRVNEEFIARLCATVAFPYGRLATCRQVHGREVRRVTVAERRWLASCDGLATDVEDTPVAVFTADCVPLLLWAPGARAVVLLHAGWRGTVAKIVAEGIAVCENNWRVRPEDIMVFLGPGIGPCCYKVGEEVITATRAAFGKKAPQVLVTREGSVYMDLHRGNELTAQGAGVLPGNIYGVKACTACAAALFESRRREGEAAGRMMAVAVVPSAASGERGGA